MTQQLERSPVEAMDSVFVEGAGVIVDSTGMVTRLAVHRWLSDASPADHQLFLAHCSGPTLDVGCGPGRLVGALAARGLHAVGIDVSNEAIRLTRARGAKALHGDVFDPLPNSGRWDHVLLADGNIGIGGDPARLLRRVRELLRPGGTALVELAAAGTGLVNTRIRMRVGEQTSTLFRWTFVGTDAIAALAATADLEVSGYLQAGDRQVALLTRNGLSRRRW